MAPHVPVPQHSATGWVYDLVLKIFSSMVGLFFREIQFRGTWRVPSRGPIILVAGPHSNQFVDSVILMRILRSLNRRISWLMAEKSFHRPFVGAMARLIGAVPVSRAMDLAKAGEGTIYLPEPVISPLLLRGIGTDFTGPAFKAGCSIYLPTINGEAHKLDIAEIRGPTELILKLAPGHSDALFQLTGKRHPTINQSPREFKGSKFKVSPHVDQTEVYNAVFETLDGGGCIGIFPEGGSHDRTSMLPLKAGIAIMALGALAKGTPVTIVPVGLNYFSAHKFRSRAVIEFGDPVDVSESLIQDFKNGKKRNAVGSLMSQIHEALTAVTVSAPDFDTLMLTHAARRLYLTNIYDSNTKISLADNVEINRRLLKGYTTYSSTPEMNHLITRLKKYIESLRALGLKDQQLLSTASIHTHFSTLFLLPKLLYRFFKLAILTFLTLPGLLLFSPVFILTSYISKRKTAEALAESSVKIRGFDVMATWKILIAGGLAPLFYTFYTLILIALNKHNRAYGFIPTGTPTWVVVFLSNTILPSITYAALLFGEQGLDLMKSLYPLVLSLSPRSSSVIEELREERMILAGIVKEMVNRFGADIFPDCDDVKKWKGRGPRSLYADISPFAELEETWGLDEFV